MTPEERAQAWLHRSGGLYPTAPKVSEAEASLAAEFAAVAEAARREERDACARICDEHAEEGLMDFAVQLETVKTHTACGPAQNDYAVSAARCASSIRQRGAHLAPERDGGR